VGQKLVYLKGQSGSVYIVDGGTANDTCFGQKKDNFVLYIFEKWWACSITFLGLVLKAWFSGFSLNIILLMQENLLHAATCTMVSVWVCMWCVNVYVI